MSVSLRASASYEDTPAFGEHGVAAASCSQGMAPFMHTSCVCTTKARSRQPARCARACLLGALRDDSPRGSGQVSSSLGVGQDCAYVPLADMGEHGSQVGPRVPHRGRQAAGTEDLQTREVWVCV